LTDALREREAQAQRDLRVAGRLLGRLMLPGPQPDWPELAWAVHFRPLGAVGGDYYAFARPDGRHLGVLVADASGHNVAAALVAVMARVAFDDAVQTALRPTDVLGVMNERLQGLADERYVTALYGVFDRIERTFTFANAGHPVPLHYDARSRACNPLDATGLMLGVLPDANFDEWSVTLDGGDLLVLHSDGVTECRNEAGEQFGEERLTRAVKDTARLGAGEVMRHVLTELAAHRGALPPGDDETLLVAELRG
jgi:phosphoserine phosphatase RsbU/P